MYKLKERIIQRYKTAVRMKNMILEYQIVLVGIIVKKMIPEVKGKLSICRSTCFSFLSL
tara:strand:- start:105 stop:281 length:177 start_codon:yes stop_codon:yes gene_type:complete